MAGTSKTRTVLVQLQRLVSELATVVVAVPADWTDDAVKAHLDDIYAMAKDGVDWWPQDDYDPSEGTHEIDVEAPPRGTAPDFVLDPDDDQD